MNKKAVTIDGYQDVAQEESALLCAVARQPVSVGIDGKSLDFQLYAGVTHIYCVILIVTCVFFRQIPILSSCPFSVLGLMRRESMMENALVIQMTYPMQY